MLKRLLPFFILFFFTKSSFSQMANVSGSMKDTTSHLNLKNAVVVLLDTKDTTIVGFTRAKSDGEYKLNNIAPGKYILMITHPQFADFVDDVNLVSGEQKIPVISLTPKSKLLETVILNAKYAMRVKGDTTSYMADSFKVSANANVEELLKKLPGIQVDKNGQIKAMGQNVEKVLVDGEEFFGDDPGMAVKNLRADAVKEVQVFDKKSDQAEFTGIDDGKTKKTINLKLKEDKKNGYFGKISLSGGLQKNIDDRYNNNLMYSTFKGKRKLSAFFLNGNTGQDGLNWQDAEKYGSNDNVTTSLTDDGGVMIMYSGNNSQDDEPYVNTNNGYIKNINAGLQYSNKFKDKNTLNISPKYNSQDYSNTTITKTQQLLGGDSSLNTNSTSDAHVNRYNVKLSGSYDIKIDSMNSLKVSVRGSYYHTESTTHDTSDMRRETGMLLSNSNNLTQNNNDKQAFYGSVFFRHKFKKARRTLSINGEYNLLNSNGDIYLTSHNQSFDINNPFVIDKNQYINNDKNTQSTSATIVYTEPLSKKFSLELSHAITYNSGKNNQQTFSYNPGNSKYDVIIDSLTNNFDQKIWVNKPGVKINYSVKKIKFNFGSAFGFTHFDLVDKTFNNDYTRNYLNFLPSASFNYMYKSNHNFSIGYQGYNTQPTINQLQPLRNSSDEFNQFIGNPDLKPSFTNQISIGNNGYNFIKDIWHYMGLQLSVVNNAITYSRMIDASSGKTITKPINTNGSFDANLYSGVGFKIKKINSRIQLGPGLYYNKFADVTNNQLSYSKTITPSFNIYLSKSKDKKYDISLSNNINYNYNRNSQSTVKNNYYSNSFSANVKVYIYKVWAITTDYQLNSRQKTELITSNLTNSLWNAGLQRTFKNDAFTVYFRVRDILNKNIGIDNYFHGNTFTQTINDRLKRYFLLGFSWDFKNKATQSK